MGHRIPQFGRRLPGAAYRLRRGGYVIVRRADWRIAVVITWQGLFLPGGGQEKGETPEQAAVREAREECAFRIRILAGVGVADELVWSPVYRRHLRKRCSFFTAALLGRDASRQPEHEVVWLPADQAAARLTHESQRWAIHAARHPDECS